MYVFGFQELDTSPEALFYSTTTTKENLWYGSIIRDMGLEAAHYTKALLFQIAYTQC